MSCSRDTKKHPKDVFYKRNSAQRITAFTKVRVDTCSPTIPTEEHNAELPLLAGRYRLRRLTYPRQVQESYSLPL